MMSTKRKRSGKTVCCGHIYVNVKNGLSQDKLFGDAGCLAQDANRAAIGEACWADCLCLHLDTDVPSIIIPSLPGGFSVFSYTYYKSHGV